MDKNVEISILMDLYSKMLTEKQYSFLDDYYNKDLSLSEMAENYNITRQAVRDNIKKGECKLFELEEKLKIMEDAKKREAKIAEILSKIAKLQESDSDKKISKTLEEVKKELNILV